MKRSGRGEPPPRPEPELRLPILTRPNSVRVTTPARLPPGKGWRAVTASSSNFVVACHPMRSCGDRGRAPCGAPRRAGACRTAPVDEGLASSTFPINWNSPAGDEAPEQPATDGCAAPPARKQLQIRIDRSWRPFHGVGIKGNRSSFPHRAGRLSARVQGFRDRQALRSATFAELGVTRSPSGTGIAVMTLNDQKAAARNFGASSISAGTAVAHAAANPAAFSKLAFGHPRSAHKGIAAERRRCRGRRRNARSAWFAKGSQYEGDCPFPRSSAAGHDVLTE